VLQHVRNVIRDTDTPSWLGSVPFNFGDAAAGTFKADQWRTVMTVYLPIALVTIWGEGTPHNSPKLAAKYRDILDHTMALVCAITQAFRRSTSRERANVFRSCLATWVQDLTKIHPNVKPKTLAHMTQHIYDFLLLFGPVHSWWCFPFERLIGILQRQPSNRRYGMLLFDYLRLLSDLAIEQLEHTMLHSFLQTSKLRCWLARPDCPPAVRECAALFDKAFGPSHEEFPWINDADDDDMFFPEDSFTHESDSDKVPVPNDLRDIVKGPKVGLRARITHNRVSYTRSSTHVGNSLIYFYSNGDRTSSPIPGSIRYIYRTKGWSLAVQRQLPLTDGTADPFRHYPHFPARLYSSHLAEQLEMVEADWVMCQFARYCISSNHAVVLSLSKVNTSPLFFPLPGLIKVIVLGRPSVDLRSNYCFPYVCFRCFPLNQFFSHDHQVMSSRKSGDERTMSAR
jgi:hypothetical protein